MCDCRDRADPRMEYSIRDGKIQTYGLEIQAAEHCNLRCAGCSQSSPFLPSRFPDLDLIGKSLSILSGVLHADRATILGGEPLLNPRLNDLLRLVRRSGVFDRIHVTTNGVLLSAMDSDFWDLVDVVEVSVYPPTRDKIFRSSGELLKRAWSSSTEMRLFPSPVFRHITLTEPIENERQVQTIYDKCYFRHYCHTLHDGHIYKCGPSTHLPDLIARVGSDPIATHDAVIRVDDGPSLQNRLLEFFRNERPMEVCRYCLGSSGAEYPHRQLSPAELITPTRVRLSAAILRDPLMAEE